MNSTAKNEACVMYLHPEEDNGTYFATAKNGIVLLDCFDKIKKMNSEAERICGVDRGKAVNRYAETVFAHLGDKFVDACCGSRDGDMSGTMIKIRVKENVFFVNLDVLPIRDAAGDLSGTVLILQDLSALNAAVKQIQTTKMLLSLGELAAGVAHHVRTPLTTISGYLQLMLNRVDNDKFAVGREQLEIMMDEVYYINNVVKELILFAKPPISKEPFVDLNRVLERALLLTFREMGGEKIALTKELAPNLPVITADDNHLQQAFVKVLENAMDAMTDGGELTVRSWMNAELNMLVVSIADTGSGFCRDMLSRAFEPFYTTKLDRMGLGLPIAQRIVAEHGGFINISANGLQGTKVHMYLALAERNRPLTVITQQTLNLQ